MVWSKMDVGRLPTWQELEAGLVKAGAPVFTA